VSVDHLSENLHGKVAIVTGAASGIGLAITRQLSEYGVSVVAEDIDPAIDNLFASLDTVASLVGDVADEQTRKTR
jgi:glucose 1-dehydrogenase